MTNRKEQIAVHMRAILLLLGVNPADPLLNTTPQRVADLYLHGLFDGLNPDHELVITPYLEPASCSEEVVIESIPCVSMCEHHLVPMIGTVTIAYRPKEHVIGFSHFYDIVRFFAHRPQLQERLTRQIADYLVQLLKTDDVCVTMQATHFCTLARTKNELTAQVTTKAAHGVYNMLAQVASLS